ncbi:hypothetical protein [Hydrogenophaga sp. OTU3427]|uniref:hypothetical protein n=1 Tax=Hydrogenophaga sp. OTU3427 TaxID=3043856 RepID=UPI00313BF688
MNPQSTFVPIAAIVYGLMLATIFLITRTASFKKQPLEDQERARKQFRIVQIGLPISLVAAWLLIGAPSGVIQNLPLFLYLALWLLVFWIGWRSYRLGIKRDLRLVKSRLGKPLKNPEALVGTFACINLALAASVAAFLVLVPVVRIPFAMWAPIVAAIAGIFNFIVTRVEQKNKA